MKIKLLVSLAMASAMFIGNAHAAKYNFHNPTLATTSAWYVNLTTSAASINYNDAIAPAAATVYGASLGLGRKMFNGAVEAEVRIGSLSASAPSIFGGITTAIDVGLITSFFVKPVFTISDAFGEVYGLVGMTAMNATRTSTFFGNQTVTTSNQSLQLSYGLGYTLKSLQGTRIGVEYQVLGTALDIFPDRTSSLNISSFNATVSYDY